uniref:hypothetical protein n=1 Tax=Exserohilum rostratum TaxID=1659837 RepID=UPI002008ECCC|nr:hypothetical protein M1U80_mgp26 [Exserohilum rostratum]UOU81284.1 hypothetical protein [Exserohilum rostratum]
MSLVVTHLVLENHTSNIVVTNIIMVVLHRQLMILFYLTMKVWTIHPIMGDPIQDQIIEKPLQDWIVEKTVQDQIMREPIQDLINNLTMETNETIISTLL